MTPRAVLLAEHEPEVAELARRYLVRAGLRVKLAATAEETMAALSTWSAGVAVLDLTMPGLDARRVRRLLAEPPAPTSPAPTSPVPALPAPTPPVPALPAPTPAVFLVGASMRPRDLRVSADQCLRRPFSPRMLVSRVLSAAARPTPRGRPGAPAPSTTVIPNTIVIPNTTVVTAASTAHTHSLLAHLVTSIAPRDIALTPAEFALLSALAAHAGRVLSRDRLRAAIGPADRPSSARAVDVHIAQLRAKLGAEPGAAIRTVRGVGYILDEPLNGAHPSSNRGVPATPLMPPR
jgi:DNA-binding response OmpR family regulator